MALAGENAALAAFPGRLRQTSTSEADIEAGEKLGFDTGLTCQTPA